MNTPPKLAFACPVPWSTMSGTERWKYCATCGHHVTNLSLLSASERAALLARARNERICGTYFLRLSGEMVTPDAPLTNGERSGLRQLGVSVLSAAALVIASGCVAGPRTPAAAAPPLPAAKAHATENDPAKPAGSENQAEKKHDDEVIILSGFLIDTDEETPAYLGKRI